MKGFWGSKSLQPEPNRRTNGNILKQMGVAKRLKVTSLNSHIICVLCSGYYVEATAIVECLHSFCRSCIIKYLQLNNFCPICEVQINKTKPWSSLRPDKTLQDLVYKLVPGLYQDEMRRRRQFYSHLGGEVDVGEGEEGGFLPHGARFFSQDDSISLSLEYYTGQEEEEEEEEEQDVSNKTVKQINEKPKRYLQCPAAVTVRHLKKFLQMKYGVGLDCWVDIIYHDECLPENFSLIDVAYTFAWKRTSPMRFAYRIFSKTTIRAVNSERNFQISRVDEGEGKKSKHQPTLEQQMQSEYLGNFNLNPTNSGFYKSQNYSKHKNNSNNLKNLKNNNSVIKGKKDDNFFKGSLEPEDGSKDKIIHSSEDSNTCGLRIISEKEEENSEDSRESLVLNEKKRKADMSVPNFGEEAVDSFTAKKLLKNKHKLQEKRRRLQDGHGEKRRRSTGHSEDYEGSKKKSVAKRRKTVADELSLYRDNEEKVLESLSIRKEKDEVAIMGNLKNEALKKVFVTKEKPENSNKRKEEQEQEQEVRKKKRKKSKHHENESRKKKLEMISTSPSIMSFAKDPLKLKVKLIPNKTVPKLSNEVNENSSSKETKSDSDKVAKKFTENDHKKLLSDKERLLHLRAVRHKNIVNKSSPKDYINTPPSLTISKVDSSEQQSVKSTLVESKPSLEIMLVSSTNSIKKKVDIRSESQKETDQKKTESSKSDVQHAEVMDNFGVLDLSEKSTRTKENSSNSSSKKDIVETSERCRKTTHQSIMQIAQNLVNRKLTPAVANSKSELGVSSESSATAAAMRNLKTLSDTAVNILMAAQNKGFPAEPQKRPFPSPTSAPAQKPINCSNSTKPSKDCENGSELRIPVYPLGRERIHPIPPVPNLHEIYPRGRGKPVPVIKSPAPAIKPGQNQTVRQIPNPFIVLNRGGNQNQNAAKPPSPPFKSENKGEANSKPKLNAIPPLQNIKTKSPLPKLEDLAEINGDKDPNSFKTMLTTKTLNNNTKTVQNGSECDIHGVKNGDEKKALAKLNSNSSAARKIENLAKNIETVAAGLTARAVSNAMIDAK